MADIQITSPTPNQQFPANPTVTVTVTGGPIQTCSARLLGVEDPVAVPGTVTAPTTATVGPLNINGQWLITVAAQSGKQESVTIVVGS